MPTSRHVLIVDDDAPILDALQTLLEDEGFVVSTATNGRDALTAVQGGLRPDIILLDVMMPVMDGWSFWRATRDLPEVARIPVVVVSADRDITGKAAAAGVPAALAKPFDIDDLLKVIDHFARP